MTAVVAFDSYAKGIVKVAQGCEERATLGQTSPIPTTLKGLFIRRAHSRRGDLHIRIATTRQTLRSIFISSQLKCPNHRASRRDASKAGMAVRAVRLSTHRSQRTHQIPLSLHAEKQSATVYPKVPRQRYHHPAGRLGQTSPPQAARQSPCPSPSAQQIMASSWQAERRRLPGRTVSF